MMTMMFYVNNSNNTNNSSKCNSNAKTDLLTRQLHSSTKCRSSCHYGCCCCQIERTENVYKTNNNNGSNNNSDNNINDIYNSSNKRIQIPYDLEPESHSKDSSSKSSSSCDSVQLVSGRGMISNSNTVVTTAGIAANLLTKPSLVSQRKPRSCAADEHVSNPSLVEWSSTENSKSCSLYSEFGKNNVYCCSPLQATAARAATSANKDELLSTTKSASTLTNRTNTTPSSSSLKTSLNHKCKKYSLKTTATTTTTTNNSSSSSRHQSSYRALTTAAYRRTRGSQLIANVHNFISLFGLQLCCLLLLRLSHLAIGLAIGGGMDSTNANLTDLGSSGMYNDL